MNTRTQQLRQLMRQHNLSVKQVAEMLNRTEQTVRIWLCKTENSKTIPQQLLELLELKAPRCRQ